MPTGPIANGLLLQYTPVEGDIGTTVTLKLSPSDNGANNQPFYSCEEPNNSYEVISLQFVAAPGDVTAANVLVNGLVTGTVSGASTYGPQGMNKGDRIAVQVPNITALDVGSLIAVAIVGYWQDSKPEPWPIPASGGLGAPPSSGGGPPSEESVTIVNPLDADGNVLVGNGPASLSTGTQPAITGAAQVIAAANPLRRGLLVSNQAAAAPATVNIYYGAGASAAIFTVQIAAGGYWEMPVPIYQGEVTAFGSAAAGHLIVTELE